MSRKKEVGWWKRGRRSNKIETGEKSMEERKRGGKRVTRKEEKREEKMKREIVVKFIDYYIKFKGIFLPDLKPQQSLIQFYLYSVSTTNRTV